MAKKTSEADTKKKGKMGDRSVKRRKDEEH